MFTSTPQFFAAARPFVASFDSWVAETRPAATADHLCYKCADAAEFEAIRALFEAESAYLYQSLISRRRIAIIKFRAPVPTALGDIWFLELSDQKLDGSQTSGFDHIEIFPASGTVESLAAALEAKGTAFEKVVRPHHTTYDAIIDGDFKVRLEPERLIEKIAAEELR
jgi:hypothetical protein